MAEEAPEELENFCLEPFEMKVQGLDRTLADKVFAICDYYMQNRVKKHSRHIYDIYKLLQIVPQTEGFKELVKEVRSVRAMTNICPSAQSNVNVPEMERLVEDYGGQIPLWEKIMDRQGSVCCTRRDFILRFLFSSSAQSSYGRSRLPYPCSLMLRKQNTCEPSSVSCSLCRSSLPCKQVLRVTNTYVLSFVVFLLIVIFCSYSEQFFYFILVRWPYCWFLFVGLCAAVWAAVRQFFSGEAVATSIAKIIAQFMFISKISSNGMMVGSSLPMAFVTPV